MRTLPTGRSSTSGVFPISSSRDDATTLGIEAPAVDRRAELAEELVDAPGSRRCIRRDGSGAVALDQVRLAAVESRQTEQVAAGIPRALFDHPLAPFAAEWCARDEGQTRSRRMMLERVRPSALGDD